MSASPYPALGHAPDYSWIAGKVSFTRIQGGCTYIVTAEQPTPQPTSQAGAGVSTVVVGTAVHSDTSPPLRDLTPIAPGAEPTQPVGDLFVPGGTGWSAIEGQVRNGDYVVLFGHVAGPGEPKEMCPGGTAYIADRAQLNP